MRGVNPRDAALLQGALWTPDQMRGFGLAAWYDAADLATITDAGSGFASPWKNKSGPSNDAGDVINVRPAITPIGSNPGRLPELRCDGSNDKLTLTTAVSPVSNAFSAVCVGECTTSATNRDLFGRATGSAAPELRISTTHTLQLISNSVALRITSSAAMSTGAYHVLGCVTATNFCSVHIDGVETTNATNPAFSNGTNLLFNTAGGIPFVGGCGEQIFFNTRISVDDRQRLEGYCAWKWDGGRAGALVGLLPASHPYKNMPPLRSGLRLRQPGLFVEVAGGAGKPTHFMHYQRQRRAA